MNMIKRILPAAFVGAMLLGTSSCQNGSSGSMTSYKGLSYKIVRHGTGKKAQIGDIIEFEIVAKSDTNKLGNTWTDLKTPPSMPLQATMKPAEWQAIFQVMQAGDSALVEISCDTILHYMPPTQQQLPPWMKKGNKVTLNISLLSVKSAAEMTQAEDKALQDYFAKNNLKPTKTNSGMYYIITKEGSGPAIEKGQKVSMNYVGKLLNGTVFDKNVDSNFHNTREFSFPVGIGRVIPGWDEGIMLLKKGSKATLFIPSPLAYGPQSPSPVIPPNSSLIFDVEVTDVQAGAPAGADEQPHP